MPAANGKNSAASDSRPISHQPVPDALASVRIPSACATGSGDLSHAHDRTASTVRIPQTVRRSARSVSPCHSAGSTAMAKAPLMEASGWRNSSTPVSRLSAQAPRRFPDLKSRSIPISATGTNAKAAFRANGPRRIQR